MPCGTQPDGRSRDCSTPATGTGVPPCRPPVIVSCGYCTPTSSCSVPMLSRVITCTCCSVPADQSKLALTEASRADWLALMLSRPWLLLAASELPPTQAASAARPGNATPTAGATDAV